MSTLYEYFNTISSFDDFSPSSPYKSGSDYYMSFQTFTPQIEHDITSVKLGIEIYSGTGGDPGNITVEIKGVDIDHLPTGVSLATVTVNGTGLVPDYFSPSYTYTEFTFSSSAHLLANTEYAIVVKTDSSDGISWYFNAVADIYLRGNRGDGLNYSDWVGYEADFLFEEYGTTSSAISIEGTCDIASGGEGTLTQTGSLLGIYGTCEIISSGDGTATVTIPIAGTCSIVSGGGVWKTISTTGTCSIVSGVRGFLVSAILDVAAARIVKRLIAVGTTNEGDGVLYYEDS